MTIHEFYKKLHPGFDPVKNKEKRFTYEEMIGFAILVHFTKDRKINNMNKFFKYFTRVLGFPFFVILAFIGVMALFFKFVINFVRFGGEAIAYTTLTDTKTIGDVYDQLLINKKEFIINKTL